MRLRDVLQQVLANDPTLATIIATVDTVTAIMASNPVEGSNWITGEGTPPANWGDPGDQYLDVTTGDVYTKE